MALARTDEFPNGDVTLAALAKAISHPARIAILRVLAEKGECICGDLVSDLPLAQSTVSQHLKALKEIGLIKGEIDGPRSCYCIDWKAVERFQKNTDGLFSRLMKFRKENDCRRP